MFGAAPVKPVSSGEYDPNVVTEIHDTFQCFTVVPFDQLDRAILPFRKAWSETYAAFMDQEMFKTVSVLESGRLGVLSFSHGHDQAPDHYPPGEAKSKSESARSNQGKRQGESRKETLTKAYSKRYYWETTPEERRAYAEGRIREVLKPNVNLVDYQTEFRLGDPTYKSFTHGGDKAIPAEVRSSDHFAEMLRFDMTPKELTAFGEIKFVSPRRMPVELEGWSMEEYLTMATGCIMVEAVEFGTWKGERGCMEAMTSLRSTSVERST
jgi:hypothetical protein